MSKQYIIMYVSGVATSYYCGYSEKWLCNQWVSCLDSNTPKIKVYSSLKDAEKDLRKIYNKVTIHTQNNYGIYEYQPEHVIPAKIGPLVTTEKENVINNLCFVRENFLVAGSFSSDLITKAINYIKENT